MHYKNGRPAQNGDVVVFFPSSGYPVVGVLYNATPGNDYCNGNLATLSGGGCYVPNLKECLHVDDARKAFQAVEAPAVDAPPATESPVTP
jgi:hypothetical protein